MANHYLSFSEVIDHLTDDETDWLKRQLQIVHVFGETEYAEGEVPEQLAPEMAEWVGCRAYREMEGYDPNCGEPVGFEYRFAHPLRGMVPASRRVGTPPRALNSSWDAVRRK